MFGRSSASKMVIDQDPAITHRKPKSRTAITVRGDEPRREVAPHVERWQRADLRPIGKAGWLSAFLRRNDPIREDCIANPPLEEWRRS